MSKTRRQTAGCAYRNIRAQPREDCCRRQRHRIAAENLTKIFNHGFTTRQTGHGFGLHSGANAAKEMGGTLNAHSEGLGKGAEFTLELPTTVSRQKAAMPTESPV